MYAPAVAVSAAEEEGVRLLDSDVSKTVLLCDVCHGPLKLPIYQAISRTNQNKLKSAFPPPN